MLFPATFVADTVAVVNGRTFPDALSLGPLAALRGGPLVLTNTPTDLSAPTEEVLAQSCAGAGAQESPLLIGGGLAAVSSSVEAQMRAAIVCDDFVGAGALDVTPAVQTNTAGQDAAVTASGTNPEGAPAVGAQITFEVFRDVLALPGPAPEDARIYREDGALFRKVAGTVLGADLVGEATFVYTSSSAAEDRIVVCTPPRELPNPGCTDETGELRADAAWATVVVRATWGDGGSSGTDPLPLPLP